MKHFLFIVCLALVAGIISTCTVFGEDPRPDDVWVEPLTGMAFVQIPSGCFMMGNTTGKSDEKPVHEACLFSFWFGQFEVTQGQWKSIMEKNPSRFTESDDLPVENISWNDAMEFISKLNEKTGEEFRLPTEAEWEYAATAGGTHLPGTYEAALDALAWYDKNSEGKTHEVGSKAPNPFGLYDILGNVWEWCRDIHSWDGYKHHEKINPLFTGPGFRNIDRGGSWSNFKGSLGATIRDRYNPKDKSSNLGIRLVRE